MAREKFSLVWNRKSIADLPRTFQKLWNDQDFTDVTLVASDNKQINVHKVILTAFSPLFKSILLNNPHQKPLLYFYDLPPHILETILKFIYLGECKIEFADVDLFLRFAKSFQIDGLVEDLDLGVIQRQMKNYRSVVGVECQTEESVQVGSTHNNDLNGVDKETMEQPIEKVTNETGLIESASENKGEYKIKVDKVERDKSENNSHKVNDHIYEPMKGPIIKTSEKVLIGNDAKISEEYESQIEKKRERNKSEKYAHKGRWISKIWDCDVCDLNFSQQKYLKEHRMTQHLGARWKCDECSGTYSSDVTLKSHKKNFHVAPNTAKKYVCDQCQLPFDRLPSLFNHKKAEHAGSLHGCDQCDYQASKLENLERHKQLQHDET